MDWKTADFGDAQHATGLLNSAAVIPGPWQPDWRATLPLAILAALLIAGCLAFLPYRWWTPSPPPAAIVIQLHPALPVMNSKPAPSHPYRTKASPTANRQPVIKAVPKAVASKSPTVNWERQLKQAAQAQARVDNPVEFLAPQAKPLDRHLDRVLNAPVEFHNLKNGEAYRSETGWTVIKSGDKCGRAKTIQIGSSPTNRATIAFPETWCPGEYHPTMGEDMKAWAAKRAKAQPPP